MIMCQVKKYDLRDAQLALAEVNIKIDEAVSLFGLFIIIVPSNKVA